MATKTSPSLKQFSAALATGAMMTFSGVTASYAEKAPEAVIDDASGLYRACLLEEGSTHNETSTKFSCTTAGGQKTTCHKGGDPDTACGTIIVEDSTRVIGGLYKRMNIIKHAPLNQRVTQGTSPNPVRSRVIMQYSMQN